MKWKEIWDFFLESIVCGYEIMRKIFVLIVIFFIRCYQVLVSPFLGKRCRFYPSCSEYASEAFRFYGVKRGMFLTLKRLGKCGPWHPGGIDQLRSTL